MRLLLILLNQFGAGLIALSLGLYTLKRMNQFYRMFFIQAIQNILILILSYLAELIPGSHKHNLWVFNLEIPIETAILYKALYIYFNEYTKKWLIGIGYIFLLIVLTIDIIINGPLVLSTLGIAAEAIVLLIPYLIIIYIQLTTQNKSWKSSPELWISLGIVIYFAGSLPFVSLYNYLAEYHSKVTLYLVFALSSGLTNVRYLLLAYSFWLIHRNATLKTIPLHE